MDTDSSLATLPDERAVKHSAQTHEVLDANRFDEDEFHRYTSRLVSAAQYEPAGRAWLTSSYCALRQARRRRRLAPSRVVAVVAAIAPPRFLYRREHAEERA